MEEPLTDPAGPTESGAGIPWWGAILLPAFALVSSMMVFVLLAWLRAAVRGGTDTEAFAALSRDPLNHAAIQAVAFGAAIAAGLLLFHRGRGLRRSLALSSVPAGAVLLAVIAGLALQLLLSEIGNLVLELHPMPIEQQLARQRMVEPTDLWHALPIIVGLVVVAPVTEELLFRGLLLPGIARRHGATAGLLLTSIAFALVHLEPTAVVPAAIAGWVLGVVVLRTGSAVPAIAVHAGVNALPLLLPERLLPIHGFNTVSEDVYHLPVPLLTGALVVAAAALFAMFRIVDAGAR